MRDMSYLPEDGGVVRYFRCRAGSTPYCANAVASSIRRVFVFDIGFLRAEMVVLRIASGESWLSLQIVRIMA